METWQAIVVAVLAFSAIFGSMFGVVRWGINGVKKDITAIRMDISRIHKRIDTFLEVKK